MRDAARHRFPRAIGTQRAQRHYVGLPIVPAPILRAAHTVNNRPALAVIVRTPVAGIVVPSQTDVAGPEAPQAIAKRRAPSRLPVRQAQPSPP